MSSRITGGKYRGRQIKVITQKDLRPTSSFIREWVFNVLNNIVELDNVRVLDLFAGSGIVGLEFLSRGAGNVTFIEKSKRAFFELKKSISTILDENDIKDKTSILNMDAFVFIKKGENLKDYNILFADAPYKMEAADEIFDILSKNCDYLPDNFILVMETFSKKDVTTPENFTLLKERKGSNTRIAIYKKN